MNARLPIRMLPTLLLPLLALALIAAGCGSDEGDSSTGAATTTAEDAAASPAVAEESAGEQAANGKQSEPKPRGTAITTAESPFGEVLFDGDQRAIYLFDKEQGNTSECYEQCAVEWPPVLTKGTPAAKGDVSQGKLGTTKRDDGSTQVTYNGRPLYYYQDDPSGVVGCHNVPGFGGLWLAVNASGDAA
jgi:predicted lipoprotein with Yx(FWY)xxD motif